MRREIWEEGLSNPYMAIDGSDHNNMDEVYKANEDFWNNILKNQDPDSTIYSVEDFRIIVEQLWYQYVDYNLWTDFYAIFKKGSSIDIYSDAFTKVFAEALLNSTVVCQFSLQNTELEKQKEDLMSVIEQLSSPGRH